MKRSFLDFIRENKVVLLLVAIIGFLLWRQYTGIYTGIGVSPTYKSFEDVNVGNEMGMVEFDASRATDSYMPAPEAPPTSTVPRLVIKDTFLSLLVLDVADVVGQIENMANRLDGFLVNSELSQPEGAASGSITVRVPEEKRAEAVAAFKALGVKTVNERVSGQDVTDQYVDIGAQLETHEVTKAKFEQILDEAVRIQDILQVQRELVNVQAQIDALKGRQQFLEGSANLARITVYLSTDEFALPFTPDTSWRPEVIFKQAVRSLILHLRALGDLVIWIAVYSAVFVPLGLAVVVIYRLVQRKRTKVSGRG